MTRRRVLAGSAALLAAPAVARAASPQVVVIGGGPGGATAARYLRAFAPDVTVTLIEPAAAYTTCFGSNAVLAGLRPIDDLEHGFDGLQQAGVTVVPDRATALDADRREVRTAANHRLAYDRCIVAAGIDFRFDALPGYDAAAAEKLPHAWKAGPQTDLLHRQLRAMPDGGVFIMVVPPNPYRCPPGPYERASLIADYFRREKPRSKVVILDAKNGFSKKSLFVEAWTSRFGFGTQQSLIEWVPSSEGGTAMEIDAARRTVRTAADSIRGDVVNIIPHQRAGAFVATAGLAGGDGWAAIDTRTFESRRAPGVHVIGDAAMAATMPKSAHAANAQGKAVAAVVAALLAAKTPPRPKLLNACYSLIGADYGISVAGVYRSDATGDNLAEVAESGGVSPLGASAAFHRREAEATAQWHAAIVRDIWGS